VAARLIDPELHFDALRTSPSGRPSSSRAPATSPLSGSSGTAAMSQSPWAGGAGLSWQLGEDTALFGEYRFTQSGSSRLLPTGRAWGARQGRGHVGSALRDLRPLL